jgi:ATP-dependent Lon protease
LRAHEHTARLQQATAIFVKLVSLLDLNTKTSVADTLTQQEKELLLRQKLAVIRRELQSFQKSGAGSELDAERGDDDGEDLATLGRKIEATEKGSEERKMGTRELRRLRRIPQGSVEHGVIRSYVRRLLLS